MQVTLGTVDEVIHAVATRKVHLDAAVLDGITACDNIRRTDAETLQVPCCSAESFFTTA